MRVDASIFALILFSTSAAGGGGGAQRNLKKTKKKKASPSPPIDDCSKLLFVNTTEYRQNLQVFKAAEPVFGNQTCDPKLNFFLGIKLCTGDTYVLSPTSVYSDEDFTASTPVVGFFTETETVVGIIFVPTSGSNNPRSQKSGTIVFTDNNEQPSSSEIVYGGYTTGAAKVSDGGADIPILGGVGRYVGVQGTVDQISGSPTDLKIKIKCL
ncbi:MAG: hypothetical protein ACI8RD_012441 [Bacillariaceae sp.]|jgi:hypothetical protein